jgi:solute carrier family 45, member 1/2/4
MNRPSVLGSWAPFTFLGIEVNRISGNSTGAPGGSAYHRISRDDSIELERPGSARSTLEHDTDDVVASTGELSGIYFGILNIYTTLPQFLGIFTSLIVFSILEPGKSPELAHDANPEEHHEIEGPNAIAVCLFIGALSALGAAYATWRLKHL